MSYLNFGTRFIDFTKTKEAIKAYSEGFVFTRIKNGQMERVRSLRINLKKFELSSENRRILRKFNHEVKVNKIPFQNYSWEIHKLGKDFYDTKFGKDTFSANKIKELFTTQNNFNAVLTFKSNENIDGYCIIFDSSQSHQMKIEDSRLKITHYAYPFYNLDLINTSFGIFMMTRAIKHFADEKFDYIYLGSVHETASLYKLQFKGLEWFDEETNTWNENFEQLKLRVLRSKV
jgi:arginyl-tRNA--protein-N-Asp/Glu arginylyltransferase